MAVRGNPVPAPIPLVPTVKIDQPVTVGTSALAADPIPVPIPLLEQPVLEGTIEPEKLAIIDPAHRLEAFTTLGGLDSIIGVITAVARKHTPDVTTKKGREAIASNAYKVARCKTLLDEAGKEETAKAKEIPNKIDAARRDMRTRLEALQIEVRKPLTDVEEAEKAAAEAEAAAKKLAQEWDDAIRDNRLFDLDRKEEAERLERMVAEREAEIAREAAEKERQKSAQREADAAAALAQAEKDKADAIQRQKDAEADAEQARKDAEAANVQAEKDAAELAERNRLAAIKAKEDADARAEQAAILARQQEQQRQEAAKKKEADELAARERDKEHKKAFNFEALTDLMANAGLTEQDAKNVINAIYLKKVRHIGIAY